MAEFNQFGSVQPSGQRSKAQCAQCEAMLTDALDHLLSPEDQRIFDLHLASCADCSRMYKEARRGADWLMMLKDAQPEPPADLLSRILASTSKATTGPATNATPAVSEAIEPNTLLGRPQLVPAAGAPAYTSNVIPFHQRVVNVFRVQTLRHNFMQPRLAMTAAMAFFSIALTLNLTGIHLTQLRASDFTPSSIKRSFYDTNAKVVRSIDNLRVVYELESRVRDLQQRDPGPASTDNNQNNNSNEQKQDDKSAPAEQKQPTPRRPGSSSTNLPARRLQYTAAVTQKQYPAHNGSPQPVARLLQVSFCTPNELRNQWNKSHSGGQA